MRFLALALLFGAAACGKSVEGAGADSRTTVTGRATFTDAETDADGAHVEAAAPIAQRGSLWLTLRGPADIDDDCADRSAGVYQASYTGAALVEHGELRASLYAASSPATTTPSGCATSRLEVHGVSDLTLLLEIPTSGLECANFCAGHARARGYDQCMNTSDQPACRATVEPGVRAACEATCMQGAAIAGYGQVTQGQLPTLDADDLQRGALGDLEVNVKLDHVVDANRQPLALP